MTNTAIVLANGLYCTPNAKTAHGLVRGSSRFRVLAVVDPSATGQDAGTLLDGKHRGIPVVASIAQALAGARERPQYCIVGMATHGGRFTPELRELLLEAAHLGLAIVNGLHDYAADDPEIAEVARREGVTITDLRKPPPKHELHFWTGEIYKLRTPRLAVLGMDCAIGKRTTTRLLVEALNEAGVKAEMIYTGQTGWMQGARYGLVFDSIVNDYVCGELEHALLACAREARPELMVIEGQSSLRNPSGPCGAEFLLAGGARGVILQHAPGREFFEGYEEQGLRIPPVEEEIALIAMYGARTLAVTLHEQGLSSAQLARTQQQLQARLGIPVVRPLTEIGRLVPAVRQYLEEEHA